MQLAPVLLAMVSQVLLEVKFHLLLAACLQQAYRSGAEEAMPASAGRGARVM